MRIAVVGNSHVSAFAEGWPKVRERHPDIEITFFGAIKAEMCHLVVKDDRLVATRPRAREWLKMTSGREDIPGDFDRYLVLGLGLGSFYFARALRTYRPMDFDSKAPTLVSWSFLRAMAQSVADESPAAIVVRNLRRITTSPITFLPCPHVSEQALSLPNTAFMRNPAVIDLALELYHTQLKRLAWDVIEQPASTLAGPAFTQSRFTRGAHHFLPGEALKDHDVNHMNGDYGALYLDEVLTAAS